MRILNEFSDLEFILRLMCHKRWNIMRISKRYWISLVVWLPWTRNAISAQILTSLTYFHCVLYIYLLSLEWEGLQKNVIHKYKYVKSVNTMVCIFLSACFSRVSSIKFVASQPGLLLPTCTPPNPQTFTLAK